MHHRSLPLLARVRLRLGSTFALAVTLLFGVVGSLKVIPAGPLQVPLAQLPVALRVNSSVQVTASGPAFGGAMRKTVAVELAVAFGQGNKPKTV